MDYSDSVILLVDDEQPVLSSLKRLLRQLKCKVHAFTSAIEALEMLKDTPVDMVISDMRMPEMGGEDFLAEVAKLYPDTERIVLSGYADAQATIEAVNRGQITRFMTKPWVDEDILKVVRKSFEISKLRDENERLQQEKEEKSKQLALLNQQLDQKVKERTKQLKQTNDSLKNSYRSVVRMFSTLTARRMGVKVSNDNLKLNRMMVQVASKSGLEGNDLKQVYYAWQMRQIGKLGFSDELLNIPYLKMDPEQQREFQNHPLLAQAASLLVKPLYPAGQVILQHKEYLDGTGYPKRLEGDRISFKAQVLCVVNDYVELVTGQYDERVYSTVEAITFMQEKASGRYNQTVVEALITVIESMSKAGETLKDKCLASDQLRPGMKLSRDLISNEGILLLSVEQVLDTVSIERIREMEFNLEESFEVYVSQ